MKCYCSKTTTKKVSLFAITLFMLSWHLMKNVQKKKNIKKLNNYTKKAVSHAQISIFIAWNPAGSSTEWQLSKWLTEMSMHLQPCPSLQPNAVWHLII